MTTTNVRDVTTSEFAETVVARSRQVPVVVDFWAEWCGPCRVLGPLLEQLAAEAAGAWELAKVDVDQNQQLAMQFGVQGIPTVVGFRNGEPVAQFTGALAEQQVRAFLDQLLPSEVDLQAEEGGRALEAGDAVTAERIWREVLASDPTHEDAGIGLAGILVDRDEPKEALAVLERLIPTDAVQRLQAAARLAQAGDLDQLEAEAGSGDPAARVEYGKALAAAGRHPEALELLVEMVAERQDGVSEEARRTAVDLFEVLGADHPATVEYRRKLAAALF